MTYDAVVAVAPGHNYIAVKAMRSLRLFSGASRIIVITNRNNFRVFQQLAGEDISVRLLDEDRLIPGVSLDSLKGYLKNRDCTPARAGWYFQQFLKMSVCGLPEIAGHYLLWDADTVMLRPVTFFDGDGAVLINPSSEYYAPYFEIITRLWGKGRNVGFSFISEHLMVRSGYMKELISDIESRTPGKRPWPWTVMDLVDDKELARSGFSEYETYGNFVALNHPDSQKPRPMRSLRYGARRFGLRPNKYDLYVLSKNYSYVSFETWDRGGRAGIAVNKVVSLLVYWFDRVLNRFRVRPA